MKFGSLPVKDAAGAILAHSQIVGGQRFRKGHVLGDGDVAALAQAGVTEITVFRLDEGDVSENDAARRLAQAVVNGVGTEAGIRLGTAGTGRVNLYAEADGLVTLDPVRVDAVNGIDEGITIATMRPFDRVDAGQIVATVKIIPFAVAGAALEQAEKAAAGKEPLVQVHAFAARRIALLQSLLPGVSDKVLDKTSGVVRARVAALGSVFAGEQRVAHSPDAVAEGLQAAIGDPSNGGGAEIVLVLGASATTDRRDVIPAAIQQAGGGIDHFGMPVDPGNLLVLAHIGDVPVLALPGSARSPRTGGNDLVLERLLAGLPMGAAEIRAMGVGGLLKEIPSRPLPRAEAAPEEARPASKKQRVAAIVLAAGQSRRMGAVNKLLAEVDGKPMLHHAIETVRAAGADPVIVVTGHERERVAASVEGMEVTLMHNPDYAEGLSTSLRAGIAAVPADCDGALVALGDMPRLTPEHVETLIAGFDPARGRTICVPVWQGKRGNPVLWARRFFDDMRRLGGDVGAKHLLGDYAEFVHEVEMPDAAILLDVDSPDALAAVGGTPGAENT